MARPSIGTSPTALAIAVAWALTLMSGVAWTVTLYNYDGEMGVTPPPSILLTSILSAIAATVLMGIAWLVWRYLNPRRWSFWFVLPAVFLAKGCLFAGAELASLAIYGPAPFTAGGFYRGAALDIITSIISGGFIALVVRALSPQRRASESAVEDTFS